MSKEITAVLVVVSVLVNVTCLIGGFISVKKRQSILLFSGLGIALGVNGVVVFHVPGGQGLVRPPHAAGALAQEAVGLPAEGHPGGGVGDLPPEGGHRLVILLMDGGGGHGLGHGGHAPIL